MNYASRKLRHGAAAVESAIALSVTFILVFGCFDVGLLVARSNELSESARQGARTAIVRGRSATELGAMGPQAMTFAADADNDIAAACRGALSTISPSEVEVSVDWPDGSNEMGESVIVTVRFSHQFTAPYLYPAGIVYLRSGSKMKIAR